jgi:hypothetical protein
MSAMTGGQIYGFLPELISKIDSLVFCAFFCFRQGAFCGSYQCGSDQKKQRSIKQKGAVKDPEMFLKQVLILAQWQA